MITPNPSLRGHPSAGPNLLGDHSPPGFFVESQNSLGFKQCRTFEKEEMGGPQQAEAESLRCSSAGSGHCPARQRWPLADATDPNCQAPEHWHPKV